MSKKKERQALIDKANNLGLEFQPNIPGAKLQKMIDDAEEVLVPVDEVVHVTAEAPLDIPYKTKETSVEKDPRAKRRQAIAEAKRKAFKTKIVTITNLDVRDAEFTTTAHLSFENNHFGLAKNVPLDIPVELEVSLIHIAETAMMPIHRDEIVGGKRTGNKVTTQTKRYGVSYAENQPG